MPTKPPTIRSKGIHVKLDRETHGRFKASLAMRGVSMQDAFEEFARLVGTGNPTACKVLEWLVKRQIREELAGTGTEPMRRGKSMPAVLDVDKLYDMISDDGTTGT